MDDGARTLEVYLAELRTRLRRLPEADVSEIVAELRSHVRDSAGDAMDEGEVAAALARLGSPGELASLYATDRLLERAGRDPSPWLLLWSLVRRATVSVAGGVALLSVIAGYLVAAGFFVAAIAKQFAPDRVGLWWLHGDEISLHLGLVAAPPPPDQELLGFWIVPLGLSLGALALWSTARFGRWAVTRLRRTPLAPLC